MISKRLGDKILARYKRNGWKLESTEQSNNGRSFFFTFLATAARYDKKSGKYIPMKV